MSEETRTTMRLEARLARLEEIVGALEREDLELEDALELFKEGIGHLKVARGTIRDSEFQIERLLEDADGETVLEPVMAESE